MKMAETISLPRGVRNPFVHQQGVRKKKKTVEVEQPSEAERADKRKVEEMG